MESSKTKNNKRRSLHQKPPRRVIFLLLLQITLQIPSPVSHTFAGKRFKYLHNHPLSTTSMHSMAVTDNGELYSISSTTVNNPTKYILQNQADGSPYPWPVVNAIALDKFHVLALVRDGSSNLKYQLFTPKTLGSMIWEGKSTADFFRAPEDTLPADTQVNFMHSVPLAGTRNFLIVILNKGIQLFRFRYSTRDMHRVIDSYTDLSGRTLTHGVLSLGRPDHLNYRVFIVAKNPGNSNKYEGQGYLFSTANRQHVQTSPPSPSPANVVQSNAEYMFAAPFGIIYGREPLSPFRPFYFGKLVWILRNDGSHQGNAIGMYENSANDVVLVSSPFDTNAENYKYLGLKEITSSRFSFVVSQLKTETQYVQGAAWTTSAAWAGTIKIWFFMCTDSDINIVTTALTFNLYSIDMKYSVSNQIAVSSTGEVMFTNDWNTAPNIVYAGTILDLGCASGERARLGTKTGNMYPRECINPNPSSGAHPVPNCIDFMSVSLSCTKCKPDAGGVSYTLYDTSTFYKFNHKSCKASNVVCNNAAGQYIKPDGSGCYACSTVANCAECIDFAQTCVKCDSNSVFDKAQESTQFEVDCVNVGGATAAGCFAGTVAGCRHCKDTHYLSSNSCLGCGVTNCARCQKASASCMVCNSGFFLGGPPGSGICSACTSPQFSLGQECGDCLHIPANTECTACGVPVNSCTTCNNGYKVNPDNDNQCEPGCVDGQYLIAGPSCPQCTSVNAGGSLNANCAKCDDTTGTCNTCNAGYLMDVNKYCFQCTSDKYWDPTPQSCKLCSTRPQNGAQCSACDALSGVCSTCTGGDTLK